MGNFQLDPGFEKAILRDDWVKEELRQRTEEMASKAKTITKSKSIRKGIEAVVEFENGRWVGRVIAKDFKSGWFEFGTVKMRARPFLAPAAMALGYHLEASRGSA